MRILVWGFGNYYRRKEAGIPRDAIIAYVSGRETGTFEGIDIIGPQDISRQQYDCLYIMTATENLFDILDELRHMGYQEWSKVVPGWNVCPYADDEKVLFEDGMIELDSEGVCVYSSPDFTMKVRNVEEWNRLRQKKFRYKKKNVVCDIPLSPISSIFGLERGLPIDRYYIEKFLSENTQYIRGTVLEVAEREYTLKYGFDVKESICMHVSDSDGGNNIIANLETGEGIIADFADCFILTQTLPFIFDIRKAVQNVVKFLKRGGVALVTVSGITQISRYDMDRWGHYWSFTSASLKRLFEECDDVEDIEVQSYGNVKTAVSGLYGLAIEDMEENELIYNDNDYQQIITAIVKKR